MSVIQTKKERADRKADTGQLSVEFVANRNGSMVNMRCAVGVSPTLAADDRRRDAGSSTTTGRPRPRPCLDHDHNHDLDHDLASTTTTTSTSTSTCSRGSQAVNGPRSPGQVDRRPLLVRRRRSAGKTPPGDDGRRGDDDDGRRLAERRSSVLGAKDLQDERNRRRLEQTARPVETIGQQPYHRHRHRPH